MNVYLEIMRPNNALMAAIAVILMAIVGHFYALPIILGFFAVFLATGAGNVINDVFDYKIDKINKPLRPIPSGRIGLKQAKNYSLALFGIAIILGFIISYLIANIWPAIVVVACSLLMYYYASTLKSLALVGNISVAVLTGLCFIFGGVIIGFNNEDYNLIIVSFYLAIFAIFMTLAREIIKDMEDIEGDKLEGARTFPIIYGKKISSLIAIVLIVVTSLICPILYIFKIFNIFYILIMIIAMVIFLYSAYDLKLNPSSATCAKVAKFLKIAMFISFIAFALGSF